MASALVLGCTGMVGSQILASLRSSSLSDFTSIHVIARRAAPNQDSSVQIKQFTERDTAKWAPHISTISPIPSVMFSALATTRGAAGGFEQQYKLEHDLNIELGKAAKEAGTKTYVLISASGSSTKSMFPYVRMKGEIEDHIKDLNFEHTIIVRPGLISGHRHESRPSEAFLRKIAAGLGRVSTHWLKDGWAQDADVIAKASIAAALKVQSGEAKDKVWILEGADIIRLGRTEWEDPK